MKTLITFGSSNLKCKEQRSCKSFHFRENFWLKDAMLTCGETWKQDQTHRNESCDLSFAIDWFNQSFNECFLSLTVIRPQCLYAMLCREPIYKQRFIGPKRPQWKISRFLKVLRFLCLPFPYKIGQEIVATTACTDPPKIVWSSYSKVKILNYFNNLVRDRDQWVTLTTWRQCLGTFNIHAKLSIISSTTLWLPKNTTSE